MFAQVILQATRWNASQCLGFGDASKSKPLIHVCSAPPAQQRGGGGGGGGGGKAGPGEMVFGVLTRHLSKDVTHEHGL